MKVAFITRSTLYTVTGGDTIQITQTAQHLVTAGVEVDIKLTDDIISYEIYDLLHFFNITRPSDILYHIHQSNKPFVVSTIFIDYTEYDQHHRKGLSGFLFHFLSGDKVEYIKTVARWLLRKDKLKSKDLLWKGQKQCIKEILKKTSVLLPNSISEYNRLVQRFGKQPKYFIVPNGINTQIFKSDVKLKKDPLLVICAARIEGIKNQLNLIKALNNTRYRLLIIGAAAPNQKSYYNECKRIACSNIKFIDNIPQVELIQYYQRATIHVLPSWFETTGLSSLEAAAMGCRIVITEKGDTREYFEDDAFYCDPSSPQSIYETIEKASKHQYDFTPKLIHNPLGDLQGTNENKLRDKILTKYTWHQATVITLHAYEHVIKMYDSKHWNFGDTWHT